jgi:chromosome partitioning protein
MRRIAVANQKGGTAKTTTTVNLAAAVAELGTSVLVLDLDPQGNASRWLGVAPASEEESRGLLDVLAPERGRRVTLEQLLVSSPTAAGVDVVAASPWLSTAEVVLSRETGGEMQLARALDTLPDRWGLVLMDCPPALGKLSVSALAAADEVLVPVETTAMPLEGVEALQDTIELVRKRLNPQLRLTAVLPSRVDRRTRLAADVVEALRERFGELVLDVEISASVRLAEAPSHQQPITTYAPSSTSADQFRRLAGALELTPAVTA